MAKVTRIKAKDLAPEKEPKNSSTRVVRSVKVKETKISSKTNKAKKAEKPKKVEKSVSSAKEGKKPFILVRPFVYFGRYLKASWQEIRQVRWPSRKTTWKLFLAILVYTLIFVVVIMLLDALFSWLFNTVIS